MQVQSLGGEDPLEEKVPTYSSTLALEIPWTEEPAGLQFMWSQRVRHAWSHLAQTQSDFSQTTFRRGSNTRFYLVSTVDPEASAHFIKYWDWRGRSCALKAKIVLGVNLFLRIRRDFIVQGDFWCMLTIQVISPSSHFIRSIKETILNFSCAAIEIVKGNESLNTSSQIVQFSSLTQSYPTLCDPMNVSIYHFLKCIV